MTKRTVVISGASGLIGTALWAALKQRGDTVVRLVRRAAVGPDEISWDPVAGTIDAGRLEGCHAIVHLAGAGIGDKRWSESYRRVLGESRTSSTSLLARTIEGLANKPSVFLSGSAIGYYGNVPTGDVIETSPAGEGFLAQLCVDWEAAAAPIAAAGVRLAFLRTGIVLTPKGGALKKQLPLFKLGVGGQMGNGRQAISWISLDDEVGAIQHLLDSAQAGPVNLTAPNPVTNAAFTKELGNALRRPTFMTVPAFAPRLLLGRQMADALLFEGARVLPQALTESGYEFRHPTLAQAFAAMFER